MATFLATVLLVGLAACGRATPGSAAPGSGGASTTAVPKSTPTAAPGGMVVRTKGIVTAMKGGFAPRSSGSAAYNYGIVLHNTSSKSAAIGVEVDVTLVPAGSTSPLPSSTLLSGIPAGGTFYLGGSAVDVGGTPSRMDVKISVERTSTARLILPPVKVSLSGSVLPHVTGSFRNPYPNSAGWQDDLNMPGTIYITYFGSHGQVVGSDHLNIDSLNGVPAAGKTETFTDQAAAPPDATSVKASIDPCDNMGGLSASCAAFQ